MPYPITPFLPRITNFSCSLFGKELISDATLQINAGRRYGLIGQNGSGKTTLMRAIAAREIPVPEHIDIWHLETEAKPEEVTAMDAVMPVFRTKNRSQRAAKARRRAPQCIFE